MSVITIKIDETVFAFNNVSDEIAANMADSIIVEKISEIKEESESLKQTCRKLGLSYEEVVGRLTDAGLSEENLSLI